MITSLQYHNNNMYIPQQDNVNVPLKHHTIKNTYSNPIKYNNNVYPQIK